MIIVKLKKYPSSKRHELVDLMSDQFTSGMLWRAGLHELCLCISAGRSLPTVALVFMSWAKTCSKVTPCMSTLASKSSSSFFVILIFTSLPFPEEEPPVSGSSLRLSRRRPSSYLLATSIIGPKSSSSSAHTMDESRLRQFPIIYYLCCQRERERREIAEGCEILYIEREGEGKRKKGVLTY